ncbi:G2/mitotic-specific cyclin-1-like [Arachis stenosperma]|uniref:G2/mitotic-specific cyclin-1-like n=1 Tax=Arachis stenosperma TaxID=217475 RepID=UPI0025AD637B|nr:G2/mitotic-specific cyclin-1-like [Arachis stenosperma]
MGDSDFTIDIHHGGKFMTNLEERGKTFVAMSNVIALYLWNEVLDMEKLMLNTLYFNMSVPTAYVFIRRFLKAAQADRKKAGSGKLTGVHRKYCSSKHNYTAKCEAASFLLDNSLL